jgi:hypothetical protein
MPIEGVDSMRSTRLAFIFVGLAIAGLALLACGGSGNDSDGSETEIPEFRDGSFDEGSAHIEMTGDKKLNVDAKGDGVAVGGFVILNFVTEEAAIAISYQSNAEKGKSGGVTISSDEIVAGGLWAECSSKVEDNANELKGEFSCKDVEAIDPHAAKTYKVSITGSFSVPRAR